MLLRLIRIALQILLFFLLLSAVVGVGSGETGLIEKGALVAFAGVLIWLASLVRRIGSVDPRFGLSNRH